MKKIFNSLLRMIVHSGLSEWKRREAATALAFGQWISSKGYLKCQTAEEAATEMGISQEQLNFFCQDRMNKKFREYRRELRIREALMILETHPDLSLEILGERVGIPDKSNFRRQFVKTMGCSPKDWVMRKCSGSGR